MNKKLKSLNQQLEEMHEEKQAAVKVSGSHPSDGFKFFLFFFFCKALKIVRIT